MRHLGLEPSHRGRGEGGAALLPVARGADDGPAAALRGLAHHGHARAYRRTLHHVWVRSATYIRGVNGLNMVGWNVAVKVEKALLFLGPRGRGPRVQKEIESGMFFIESRCRDVVGCSLAACSIKIE